jgi:protein-tyrosine phosphatase
MSLALRSSLLLLLASFSWAQQGTSFKHFAAIDKQVYVGSKPHTDKDFELLQSQHVRYILNARFLPFFSGSEKRKAQHYGMQFLDVPMNASPIPPMRRHVDKILLTMHDAQFQPIYIHCVLGRDRTSLLSGLYKIYFLGVSQSDAFAEMKKSGFRTVWFLHGLNAYFEKNAARKPESVAKR